MISSTSLSMKSISCYYVTALRAYNVTLEDSLEAKVETNRT